MLGATGLRSFGSPDTRSRQWFPGQRGSGRGPLKNSRVQVDLDNLEAWAASLDPDAEVVLEASTNAFHIHDVLLPHVNRVAVAHPLYLRWIAESRMKTNKLDSEKLVLLLNADLIPEVWVPSPAQRDLRAVVHRREKLIAARTREAKLAQFPFAILGLDSDNGSEFINHHLLDYCQQHELTFTRSRPERKNDNYYVEQKN